MKRFFRLFHIVWIIKQYFNFWHLRPKFPYTRGQALRLSLERLGPIFVKFGQTLSTRRDLLREDMADELEKLQDKVPPFSEKEVIHKLQQIYGDSFDHIFTEFESQPLASASIAQIHGAKLKNGKEIIIKILRPHIKKQIKGDIALMYLLAKYGGKMSRRFKVKEIIAEFETSILGELDLLQEAASASQLKRNFLNTEVLYVPEVYWEYTTHDVMVMERIYGIPVRDKAALIAHGIDLKKLAERGVEIFFTQAFRDSFFHADMHPGNIFISLKNPQNPCYILVDFGIMGSLNPEDQRYIAENFLAFFNRDYRRVAILHVESGWAPAKTRIDQLETAIRTVCEPIFERPLGEISFGQLLLRLFQMASKFDIQIQPQLILLQKTLLNIEGLGRQLYPELDLWKTAKPFLERWIKSQIGFKAFIKKIKENAPIWLEELPELPHLVYRVLKQLAREKR
jgi:ubiquinone biosynthesis protein